jgi:hypothetical protein
VKRDNFLVEYSQLYFSSSFVLMTGEYRFRLLREGIC